ncbi:patatin-like phospholipase family protein [Tsukamurella paurometabola]|uniref:Patatin n=1 Tax=Tsukamurella paurometabola (strain ATCC 8368 / DSM 20162 / CCUG 35730 / CIP 100753 / JCM 10117 / KCTC 9821 / NBRC 16120 / NCIMB 702349 / NCTC 13040) TaxID=521096 RepID=D5UNQ1_TSUPD|nr:patatin-like phospholipase family protein [Tsukamurella paurometabola]ADG78619.1 Patatin [Tsukamurella paurometabola DSM 20162]SUP32449.1 Patatin [Tsukamurella paurometabola]
MNASRTADLVLEGGGVRGIALLGAVTELASAGFRFPRIGGTSAGAVIGALVAAYQRAERPLDELVVALDEVDFPRFTAEPALQRALGPVGDGAAILLHEGIHSGDYLLEWLTPLLARVGVRTFADLRIDDDPGTSLADYQRYAFVATASDVSRRVLVRLPWDYDQYGLTADEQSVAAAVRASMAVPFFFRPVRVETDRGAVTWVDGGLLSNFPVQMFDRSDGRADRWPTLGIKLSAEPGDARPDAPLSNPVSLAIGCLRTAIDQDANRYRLADECISRRTVYIDTGDVSSLDFSLDAAARARLLQAGRDAARAFLTTQDHGLA